MTAPCQQGGSQPTSQREGVTVQSQFSQIAPVLDECSCVFSLHQSCCSEPLSGAAQSWNSNGLGSNARLGLNGRLCWVRCRGGRVQ
eukprot:6068221-Prymnesium_polylepis.1